MNELVVEDDDPTAELETLADTYDFIGQQKEKDDDPSIVELKSDLADRSEKIDRLQFDIEQLRARWTGLEAEIKAREELSESLNKKLNDAEGKLARKEKLLKQRDQTIKSLKAEIRDRNDGFSALQTTLADYERRIDALQKELDEERSAEMEAAERETQRQRGRLASAESEVRELRGQLERTEAYADEIRQKLQEFTTLTSEAEDTRENLVADLAHATAQVEQLEQELGSTQASLKTLSEEMSGIKDAHQEEIRMIRFELGEAQETVAQHELISEQLASDLVDTRGFRDELEKMYEQAKEQNATHIEELERENRRLKAEIEHHEEELESKSEAINTLLAELAKKSQEIESLGEIEEVIHEIDDRMSERIDERSSRDRVTRVLIGTVDGQELRFPLFKDRLTIGRTDQNDIQLNASYVSRRHAVVVTDHESTRVIDWGSKNGVFVGGERVTEHFLRNGDIVTIGTARFRYEERPKRDA
ncbi:MAG: FHA domain-containing protein [Woeseiaceae bacterium]